MTGAGTGAGGLEFKTFSRIRWRLSSEYLTTKKSAEPKATSGATTSAIARVQARVPAGAGVQRLIPLVGVPPASSSLPL